MAKKNDNVKLYDAQLAALKEIPKQQQDFQFDLAKVTYNFTVRNGHNEYEVDVEGLKAGLLEIGKNAAEAKGDITFNASIKPENMYPIIQLLTGFDYNAFNQIQTDTNPADTLTDINEAVKQYGKILETDILKALDIEKNKDTFSTYLEDKLMQHDKPELASRVKDISNTAEGHKLGYQLFKVLA